MSKVLGMGNALVDILTRIESDELLTQLNLPKGSMQLVDSNIANDVLTRTNHYQRHQASGGSAANTIHGLASLGVETGFLGKVGKDELGEFFKSDMQQHQISTRLLESDTPSGKAIALISPDSERTFATHLGAAVELCEDDLFDELFHGYKYFYIEGYLVQNKPLIRKAIELAKKHGLVVSLDLASYNVVEANLDFLKEIIASHVDIVFANEEEAHAFTGKTGEDALHEIASLCDIAVVKQGKNGSLIKRFGEVIRVGIIPAQSTDTTGAGDLYAAGFLFGLIQNLHLEKCGQIGALLSGNVIEVVGPKMDQDRWGNIKKSIEAIVN
ncbi:MAG: adenosine kinase [Marinilabiliaceae bacterium]|nr:adenosine kinase [Marinilabiliaceae bacterium]